MASIAQKAVNTQQSVRNGRALVDGLVLTLGAATALAGFMSERIGWMVAGI